MNPLLIHISSVVFVVENNRPAMFGPDYLSHHNVFPANLTVAQNITAGPLSQVVYADNYLFQAHDTTIKLEHRYDPPTDARTWDGDLIGNAAANFLGASGFLRFLAMGINFGVTVGDASVAPLFHPDALPMGGTFFDLACRLDAEGFSYLQLKLETAVIAGETPGVLANANFHLALEDVEATGRQARMQEALGRRQEAMQHFIHVIDEIPFGHAEHPLV